MKNILVLTLGMSWQIVPEAVGFTNPDAYDFFAGSDEVSRIRKQYNIEPVDECWIVTVEGLDLTAMQAWAQKWHINLRFIICAGVKDFSSEDEISTMRSLIYRTVLNAVAYAHGGKLYLSLSGGRKTMSADMQDAANLFVYLPRKASLGELIFVLVACTIFMGYIAFNRGGEIQNIVKMKTNVQDPRSATIIDLIYASLLLYFIQLNNIPMSTTWVFLGLLAGREIALYHRLRFESPKKMYKHILKDLAKVTFGMIVSLLTVLILTKFHVVKDFFIMHFINM